MHKFSNYGHPEVALGFRSTLAQIKAQNVNLNLPYLEDFIRDDNSVWYYHPTSVLAGDDQFVIAPDAIGGVAQAGRYLRKPGPVDMKFPIGFATADAAVLATLPVGAALLVQRGLWEVTIDWTGGSSSTIGASSSQTGHTTKGDLHGGAAGDLAAVLVASAGLTLGTIGVDIAAGVLLKATATIRHDRITSAYTTGAGFLHLIGVLQSNPGA